MPNLREDFTLPVDENEDGIAEGVNNQGENEPSSGKRKRSKIYIPLNEDGSIMESRFKDKAAFEQLVGHLPASTTSPDFEVDRDSIPILYDGVAMAIQQMGKMFLKWPSDLTSLMQYSKEQKERLTKPTAKVIEKFAPAWLLKHQEVVALALCFSACTKEMVEGAVQTYVKIKQAEQIIQPAAA